MDGKPHVSFCPASHQLQNRSLTLLQSVQAGMGDVSLLAVTSVSCSFTSLPLHRFQLPYSVVKRSFDLCCFSTPSCSYGGPAVLVAETTIPDDWGGGGHTATKICITLSQILLKHCRKNPYYLAANSTETLPQKSVLRCRKFY